MISLYILFLVLISTNIEARLYNRAYTNIPDHLQHCYENGTLYENEERMQPSIYTLISILGKLERSIGSNLDLRTFSSTILHKYRLDGMERVPDVPIGPGIIPFAPNGRQYPKYQVVVEKLIPPGINFDDQVLSDYEKCALHFMLSASVQPWYRGDEFEVCPLSAIGGRSMGVSNNSPRSWAEWPTDPEEKPPSNSGDVSRCPIEEGVLWTPWGTVSGAALIGGISAALHPQRVPISSLRKHRGRTEELPPVDNVWGATLSGDLAEVAVYQGPKAPDATFMRMGPGGFWNDTAYSRMFYFEPWSGTQGSWDHLSWDMTESEHRGGTDGLVLGSKLPRYLATIGSLKLTQVLDMYYSERGIAMENGVRACRRPDLFAESVNYETLQIQTESFAKVLQDYAPSLPIAPVSLTLFVKNSIKAYRSFADAVFAKDVELTPCTESITVIPKIELLVIFDGTWTSWEGQRVVNILERHIDVSAFGSAIATMDGYLGKILTNFTRLSSTTVRRLDNVESWPIGLNMELSTRTARKVMQRRRAIEAKLNENLSANSRGTVVLYLANTATNTEEQLRRAKEEQNTAKQLMPDITWLFVTARRKEEYEPFVENPSRDIILSDEGELDSFLPTLINRLREVPGRIIPAMCPQLIQDSLQGLPETIEWTPVRPKGPMNEDYVTPGEKRLYRVPPASLLGATRVKFTIQASSYGDLVVCMSRVQPGIVTEQPNFPNIPKNYEERCDSLLANNEMKFEISQPCSNMIESDCKPVFLWITVQRTELKCTEEQCRYPDQVRYALWHEGLNPLPNCKSNSMKITYSIWVSLVMTLILKYTH